MNGGFGITAIHLTVRGAVDGLDEGGLRRPAQDCEGRTAPPKSRKHSRWCRASTLEIRGLGRVSGCSEDAERRSSPQSSSRILSTAGARS